MKKVISILLAALMLFSLTGVVAAAETGCQHTHKTEAPCTCCVYCPNLDLGYLTSCGKNDSKDGKFDGSLCCSKCTGIFPCNCGCSCCAENENITDNDSTLDDIWGDQQQDDFVASFQAILKKISDWFDEIFDAIFAFLRIGEVVG